MPLKSAPFVAVPILSTFTQIRAAYNAANAGAEARDKKVRDQSMRILQYLASLNSDNEYVRKAMINYGTRLIEKGQKEEGIRCLQRVPKHDQQYYALAQFHINQTRDKN